MNVFSLSLKKKNNNNNFKRIFLVFCRVRLPTTTHWWIPYKQERTIESTHLSFPPSPEPENTSQAPSIHPSLRGPLPLFPPRRRSGCRLPPPGLGARSWATTPTLSRASKRPWPSTRPAAGGRSSSLMRARCTVRPDQAAKDKALQSMATMSSAQIISPAAFQNKMALQGLSRPAYPTAVYEMGSQGSNIPLSPLLPPPSIKPFSQQSYTMQASGPAPITGYESTAGLSMSPGAPPWQGRCIASSKLRMLEFSAFLEQPQDPDTFNKHLFVHIGQSNPSYSDPYLESVDVRQIYDKFPEKKGGLKELFDKGPHNAFFLVKFWADLSVNLQDDSSFFYGVSSQYESSESMIITSSTKVCSFGKQVVEKVETEYARFENGRYMFRIHRSPLCEYMINFIHKLKHLPEKYMMNSVLENFTILQVVSNRDTLETLLCVAYVFEVSTSEHGAQHHIYRLVKD
uniref:TEA domain transcription factor 4 n=1 Tax=Hippocampus comes TaxID=109280 RepID=A0A3Q2YM28_HIPCM